MFVRKLSSFVNNFRFIRICKLPPILPEFRVHASFKIINSLSLGAVPMEQYLAVDPLRFTLVLASELRKC